MLEIAGLTVGYGAAPVLHGIDLSLKQGEIVTLLGSNGAGKSTLVKSISGLMRSMSGAIRFDGRDISAMMPAERLRLGIAHVPEGRQVFAGMTIRDNLALGGYVGGGGQAERLRGAFEQFPMLQERLGGLAGNISGGQQQMLAIARGLMSGPRLLLLDEPSLGLSPLLVAEVFRMIRQLRDRGLTILLAEQNARSALSIADRAYVIENGRVTMSGPAAELASSSDIADRYLGGGGPVAQSDTVVADLAAKLRACIGQPAQV